MQIGDISYAVIAAVAAMAADSVLGARSASAPAETSLTHAVTAKGAKLVLVADTFEFTEGPAADVQGNVYFTDQPNNRIHRWSVDGKLSVFMEPAGRANGMFFDAAGNLLACADERNELWSIAPDGKASVLVKDFGGKLLNGPNDVWAHPDGSIYFTDPYFKRPYWKRGGPEQGGQHVYRLSADREKVTRVTTDLKQPNGLIGTPDGKTLYVADPGASRTYVYEIAADGTLANKRLFCASGSDGMTLDSEGNVYLTGKGVTVFNKDGREIERIAVPQAWTANLTIGGAEHRTLFITATKAIYTIELRTSAAR